MEAQEEVPVVVGKEEAVDVVQGFVRRWRRWRQLLLSGRTLACSPLLLWGAALWPRCQLLPVTGIHTLPLGAPPALIGRVLRCPQVQLLGEEEAGHELVHQLVDGTLVLLLDGWLPLHVVAYECSCILQDLPVLVHEDKVWLAGRGTAAFRVLLLVLGTGWLSGRN